MDARLLHHDLPLALVLLHVVTLRWSAGDGDGVLPALYGFPLPCAGWSGVSSLEWCFAPTLVLVDLLVWWGGVALVRSLLGALRRPGLQAAAWVGAVKVGAGLLVALDLFFVAIGAFRAHDHTDLVMMQLERVEPCLILPSPSTGDPPMRCAVTEGP